MNALAILKKYRRVKEHELSLITTTYAIQRALTGVWEDKSKLVSISFSIFVEGTWYASPSVEC